MNSLLANDITYRQLDGKNFYRMISSDDTIRQRIKYLSTGYTSIRSELDIYAEHAGQVIAVAGLQHSPYEANTLWIMFVSVDPAYQKNGIATKLLNKIFEYAAQNQLTIVPSSYSEMGEKFLTNVMITIQNKFANVIVRKQSS